MSTTKNPDTYYLERLSKEIEEKLGWGRIDDWSERNFQELCDLLEQQTNERVSITTLKRIMGRLERKNNPHLRTLNSIATFVGYDGWPHYKSVTNTGTEGQKMPAEPTEETPPEEIISKATDPITDQPIDEREITPPVASAQTNIYPNQQTKKPAWRKWLRAAELSIVALALGYLVYSFLNRDKPDNRQTNTNKDVNTEAEGNTVAVSPDETKNDDTTPNKKNVIDLSYSRFDYDKNEFVVNLKYYLPDIKMTNVNLIRFDERLNYLNINEDSKQGTATYTYHKPGIYQVKIFSNKQTLAERSIVIPTKDWLGHLHFSGKELKSIPFDVRQNGREELAALATDKHMRLWTNYRYFHNFSISGEAFILKTKFRNTPANNETRDGNTFIEVLGDGNKIRIQLANKSSSTGFFQVFSEQKEQVKTGPFAFRANLSDWQQLTIQNRNKELTIKLGNRVLHQTTYTQPIGVIKGFVFSFTGLGEIDYLKIYDLEEQLVYSEEFAGQPAF